MNNSVMTSNKTLIFFTTVIAIFSICPLITETSGENVDKKAETIVRNCTIHAHCQDSEACVHERECMPVCREGSCGINAICSASKHIRRCKCPLEYKGDPYKKCQKTCDSNDGCEDNEQCTDEHQCIPLCERNKCSKSAYCIAENHVHECVCPSDSTGDPLVNCTKKCTMNSHCDDNQICEKNTCIEGCESLKCGVKGRCLTIEHKPRCHCGYNFITEGSCDSYCDKHRDCDIMSQTCKNHRCIDEWNWAIITEPHKIH